MSRVNATRYRGRDPYIVISIRSPRESVPKLREDPFRVARMNLAFDDWAPEWAAVYGTDDAVCMTEAHASRIAQFVARHLQTAKHCVVHCRHGISRSAGVAAGILEALGDASASAFEVPPYEPNPHVRKLVRDAFRAQITAKGKTKMVYE